MKAGDRIVALDGHPIHSPNDLTDRLDRTAAGAEVAVSLLRGDAPHRDRLALTVHTGPRPAPPEKNKPAPDKDKDKPERARPDPPPPPGSPDRIERLERRLKELERELRDLRKGRAADVARKS